MSGFYPNMLGPPGSTEPPPAYNPNNKNQAYPGAAPAPYGGPAPASNSGAPPGFYGAGPAPGAPGAAPIYGQPSYGQPPPAYGQPAYGQPAPSPYGAPPSPYGAPPPAAPYGQPQSQGSAMMMGGGGYGAPPPQQGGIAYGIPVGGPVGGPPPGMQQGGYGGVPPSLGPPGGGRKKALLIGINYTGSSAQLNGCINDARCLEYCLKSRFGFQQQNMLILTDDQRDPNFIPTRANILNAMRWLVQDAGPGDSLFFSYSGHGGQARSYNSDEADGMNETFCPVDFKRAGEILDDEVNALMIRPLGPGVRLHAITDCCHSGSSFDLPYLAGVRGRIPQWISQERVMKGTAGGFVVQFSACQDQEVAADTSSLAGNAHTGAATFCFIDAIEKMGPQAPYGNILAHMDSVIEQKVGGRPGGGMGGRGGGMLGGFGGGRGGGMMGGRGGGRLGGGLMGAGLGALVGGLLFDDAGGMLLGAAAGGAAGAMAGGGGSWDGQNPILSSNERFDLNRPLCIL